METEDFKQWLLGLCRGLNKDGVVFSDGESIYYMLYDGEMTELGEGVTLCRISRSYSEFLKPKSKNPIPFIFEGVVRPSSQVGLMYFTDNNLKWL